MPPDDLSRGIERDLAFADLCRLAAVCHYEPEAEFADEGVFRAMVAAAATLDDGLARCAERLRDGFAASGLHELRVDYSRLFLGPPSPLAKPYASSWLSPAAGEDATAAILKLYGEAGLEVDDGFRELPDHVAAELELLYLLVRRSATAALAGDASGRGEAEALRHRLARDHLGRWIGPFTEAVSTGAGTDFYRELARFTARLLALEAALAA